MVTTFEPRLGRTRDPNVRSVFFTRAIG